MNALRKIFSKNIDFYSLASIDLADFVWKAASPNEKILYLAKIMETTIGIKPYSVQLEAVSAMYVSGKMVEMNTGEGKTYVAALMIALKAMDGHHVHAATANEYLAKRDANALRPFYSELGLNVDYVSSQKDFSEKNDAYLSDIVYGTAQQFAFDQMRNHLAPDIHSILNLKFDVLILDEVDSLLIDEATVPLAMSRNDTRGSNAVNILFPVLEALNEGEHFTIDQEEMSVSIEEAGYELIIDILMATRQLRNRNLFAPGTAYLDEVMKSLIAAQYIYKKGKHYIVQNGRVILIDESTGRPSPDKKWESFIHQSVERKEDLEVRPVGVTMMSKTYKSFIHQYRYVNGLSGTIHWSREEIEDNYGLGVVKIQPNVPSQRLDEPDRIYRTHEERMQAVLERTRKAKAEGQPVLIGTDSVAMAKEYSRALDDAGIEHECLTAENPEREADIIANAGSLGAVTVATQMAGRGTDIKLKDDSVKAAGGLLVLGTFRGISRRVDLQLMGRSGRQGEPGQTAFYLSLDDELIKVFAGKNIERIMNTMQLEEGQAIKSTMLSKAVQRAQKARESLDRSVRHEHTKFDKVADVHRQHYINDREIWVSPSSKTHKEILPEYVQAALIESARNIAEQFEERDDESAARLKAKIATTWNVELSDDAITALLKANDMAAKLSEIAKGYWEFRLSKMDTAKRNEFIRLAILEGMDLAYQEQLRELEILKQAAGLQAYAQKDPKAYLLTQAYGMIDQLRAEAQLITGDKLLGTYIPQKPE